MIPTRKANQAYNWICRWLYQLPDASRRIGPTALLFVRPTAAGSDWAGRHPRDRNGTTAPQMSPWENIPQAVQRVWMQSERTACLYQGPVCRGFLRRQRSAEILVIPIRVVCYLGVDFFFGFTLSWFVSFALNTMGGINWSEIRVICWTSYPCGAAEYH